MKMQKKGGEKLHKIKKEPENIGKPTFASSKNWCRCPLAVPEIFCSLAAHKVSTAAHAFAPLLLPLAARGNAAGLDLHVLLRRK